MISSHKFVRPQINLGYGQSLPEGVSSLFELIVFNATHNPHHIFGLQARPGQAFPCEITFSQLQLAVERASAWLVHTGATTVRHPSEEQKPPVAILLGSDISIFIYLAALLRIGTPVVILSARLAPIAIAHLLQETRTSAVLSSPQFSKTIEGAQSLLPSSYRLLPIDAFSYEDFIASLHALLDSLPVPPIYTDFSQHDLKALIMHSSGTTGLPKPIYHSHNFILGYATCHRLPDQEDAFGFNVSTLPLYHGFGLLSPCLSLSIGMPFVLPPATIIPTARTTLALLRSTHAKYMLSVPSILEDVYNLPGHGLQTLQSLEIIAIGGAPMKESVGQSLVKAGVNLLNHWGATELGAIAPIERIPHGYDWHYLMPRDDIGLQIIPADETGDSTFRIIGHAVGWSQPFVVQDLLEAHPHDRKQFRIKGRADDLIVLSNGEKICPTAFELTISEHPDVLAVLAFGDRCPAIGLLIQHSTSASREEMLASIIPFLQRGNFATETHGRVSIDMIVFTAASFARTDKGSLSRNTTIAAFEKDIKKCYARRQLIQPTTPLPPKDLALGLALRDALRRIVHEVTGHIEYHDDTDFFESRIIDSLQATRVRHGILCGLRATAETSSVILASDFCFQHPSINRLYQAVGEIMSGNSSWKQDLGTRRISDMKSMVEVYRAELHRYMADANMARELRTQAVARGSHTVLVTGTTGSLGCMIVASLLQMDSVDRIICLNRSSECSDPVQRQANAFAQRGVRLRPEQWEKIVVLDSADTSTKHLGLTESQFNELLAVTHIIHNAWPVNFNRNLTSFNGSVKTLCNLIHLAILSHGRSPTRILFASSIAVVGQIPQSNRPSLVPELPVEPECTARLGYAEAKWVCESILQIASDLYSGSTFGEPLIMASSVRIGQLSGPEISGVWNTSEHIPRIIRTSKVIGALPELRGELAWIPANRAADVLVELLFSETFRPFYHLENPSRQSWGSVMSQFASLLNDGSCRSFPVLPFTEWLDRVRELGRDGSNVLKIENTALAVIDFLERDFIRMAAGGVTLDTSNACRDSSVLRESNILTTHHLKGYLRYWDTKPM